MKLKYTGLLLALAGLLMGSCKKNTQVFNDPYANGKEALGISTNAQQIPVPAEGKAGTLVTISATGLKKHEGKLAFLFNGQPGKIKSITETGIQVEVPANASSGVTSFVVDGQLVFGPVFTVLGKVNLDPTFVATSGTDAAVYKAFPVPLTTDLILLGAFSDYNGQGAIKRQNKIIRIAADGTWDRSFLSSSGANNTIWDMAKVGPYYYIVGDFTGYAQQGSGINRITRLNVSGQIDTMVVTTYQKRSRFVPTFNGGVTGTGGVHEIYADGTNKMIITGDFDYYVSKRYDQYTFDYKDSTVTDSTTVRQICRLNENGTLDSTWRFDKNAVGYEGRLGRSWEGANGQLRSIRQPDGKIVCYGKFTTFDGKSAGRIVRLNGSDGSIDGTFNVGTGADQEITLVTLNAATGKFLVVGNFNNFNGKPLQYMVQLNSDGSVDESFTAKQFIGGVPQYAKALSDGMIILNGSFRTYGGVIRNGFAFLNPDGTLKDEFNTVGNLTGQIRDTYEMRSTDNKRALLIMGNFSNFDSKIKKNLIRVTLE